ncbi:uncharacterized protein Bfra_003524 [Botrytis fragariae]|uniref:Uncharacterized protein n=1 Tax=Botrytis fragariae TaxID=1964551 RepID=A0A8H6EKC9_9HELO|nr:uncharacterized protein Bfra_003524 [Botrytis fragariae]KAF5875070.1 hypothetical protein Bfra_003524 [Botrytis fragariae]
MRETATTWHILDIKVIDEEYSDLLSHTNQIVTAFLTSASVYIRDIVSCFSVFGERGFNWNSRWARVTKRVTMYMTTA